jgi:YD repeat-containing protein
MAQQERLFPNALELPSERYGESKHLSNALQQLKIGTARQPEQVGLTADTASKHLPSMHLHSSAARRDLVMHGKNGRETSVTAIDPCPGESLSELLKRLHPDLSANQLSREIRHTLQYNKQFGHDLGDGTPLDPNKAVFLTSIKHLDAAGRTTMIESPNGRTTEFAYDDKGLTGYRITLPNGTIEENACRNGNGSWSLISANGCHKTIASASVDSTGAILAVDNSGNRLTHLTRGDDISTSFQDGKAQTSITTRNGQMLSRSNYEYTNDKVSEYAYYGDSPNKPVLLNEHPLGDASDNNAIDMPRSERANRIVSAALETAGKLNTFTNCGTGVAKAMLDAGVGDFNGATAVEIGADMQRSGKFERIPVAEVQPGDVIVRNWSQSVIAHSNGHNWGDIVIVCGKDSQGQLLGANDHKDIIPQDGGRYTDSYALRVIA